MKILIVGAGVSGLVLAGFLKKYQVGEVTIVERGPGFRTIGYLITLWGNGRRVLQELGAGERIAKAGREIFWDMIESSGGRRLTAIDLEPFTKDNPTMVISRSDVHSALIETVMPVDVRFGSTISHIQQQNDGVHVELSDGSAATYDLVVGADGTRSSVREKVFGSQYLKQYEWSVWMYWLRGTFAPHAISTLGKNRTCAIIPSHDKAMAVFIAPALSAGERAEDHKKQLSKIFSDFNPSTQKLINAAPSSGIFHDRLAYVDLDSPCKGNVVVIGDAHHAASPVTGMGASIALEDAYVLADELRRMENTDIETMLGRYAARRLPHVEKFRRAVDQVNAWMLADGIMATARDAILPFMPTSYFTARVRDLLETKI